MKVTSPSVEDTVSKLQARLRAAEGALDRIEQRLTAMHSGALATSYRRITERVLEVVREERARVEGERGEG